MGPASYDLFCRLLQVENYLAADLTPHNATEAALQTGHIPSNTADVTHSSHGPGAGSTPVRYAADGSPNDQSFCSSCAHQPCSTVLPIT